MNNTVRLPKAVPAGYSTTAGIAVYGVLANEGFVVQGNTLVADAPGTGTAARLVGVSLATDGTVGGSTDPTGNILQNLDTGIEALSGNTLLPTNYNFSKNTLAGYSIGIVFRPSPMTYDYGALPPLNVTMRCNTFGFSYGGYGVRVEPYTRFVKTLGSSTLPGGPNGNDFFSIDPVKNRFINLGSGTLEYFQYKSTHEDIGQSTIALKVTGVGSPQDAFQACNGGAGINYLMANTANLSRTTTEQSAGSDSPAAPAALATKSGGANRSLNGFDQAAEQLNSRRYEQVLTHQRLAPPRPGIPTLTATDRQLLREMAASGTAAAHPACQLLRFYEPNCHCVLPVSPAIQPALAAQSNVEAALPLLGEAHPNPASETVVLTYALAESSIATRLVVYDLLGRPALTQLLTESRGEATLPVRGLAAGLYVVALEQEGRVLSTRRLAVSR